MDSIIPLPSYTPLFYYTMLFLVLMSVLKLSVSPQQLENHGKKSYATLILFFTITLYMGLRPISYYFGDMMNYYKSFVQYSNGAPLKVDKDILWEFFIQTSSHLISAKSFFLICSFLYLFPLFHLCQKFFKNNSFIPFLMLFCSFSFWPYGVNGIRNGVATSLFLLAFASSNKLSKYFLMVVSLFIHASLIIPTVAYLLTNLHKNTKHYLIGWLCAIPLSIGLGGFWENLFLFLDFGDKRIQYLTDTTYADSFASTGFRWDFLLYSATAVFAGYYFVIKKKFSDHLYIQIFNIYLIANSFWILVIRASFSNRFAYLSWFLMALVIFYPFFKRQFFEQQSRKIAVIVTIYFGFTFYMFLIA